jgi:hypothetical protein
MCIGHGYVIQELAMEQAEGAAVDERRVIRFQMAGRRGVEAMVVAIADIKGVVTASVAHAQQTKD